MKRTQRDNDDDADQTAAKCRKPSATTSGSNNELNSQLPRNETKVVELDPSAKQYPRGPTSCSYWLLPDKKICVGRCPGTLYTDAELKAAGDSAKSCLAAEWSDILATGVTMVVNVTADNNGEADDYDWCDQLRQARPALKYVRIPIDRDDKFKDIDMQAVCKSATTIVDEVKMGGCVYLHCLGGHTRSGCIAVVVLKMLRPTLTMQQAIDYNRRAHQTRQSAHKRNITMWKHQQRQLLNFRLHDGVDSGPTAGPPTSK